METTMTRMMIMIVRRTQAQTHPPTVTSAVVMKRLKKRLLKRLMKRQKVI
jgi:hypothetical protein